MVRKILLSGLLIFLGASMSFAQVAERDIVAEGKAAGDSLQARDAALNRALRNAVEQAVGALVDSETRVENFQLLDDKIYSEVKGYVTNYEIIDDNKGAGGIYAIKVKADVALGALTKDIKALGLIREKMDYPRVVVLIDEYIDGVIQPRHIVAGEIEKIFMSNKFPVVSLPQMQLIKERDATLAYQDPDKAAALGRRFGAEVAIVGQVTSDLLESSAPYGVSVFAYEARIDAKAVKTDNARVIAVDSATAQARGSGRVPAANKAISDLADTFSRSIMKEIAEAWRDELYNETTIEVVCENASLYRSNQLQEALKAKRDVKGVSERSIVNNVLVLDVRFFGSADQLAVILEELEEPRVMVLNKTASRLDVKIID